MMEFSDKLHDIILAAEHAAFIERNVLLTPEQILLQLMQEPEVASAINSCGGISTADAIGMLRDYLSRLEKRPPEGQEGAEDRPTLSFQATSMLQLAAEQAESSAADYIEVGHVLYAILHLRDSNAAFVLRNAINNNEGEFLAALLDSHVEPERQPVGAETASPSGASDDWRNMVMCINDHLADHNPLIGREQELERTIQVLCRKDKNNPLHIGEPGVGKTSIAYGLAQRIEDGNVPPRLKGCRIYQLDLGGLIAGTQYRGQFEERLKKVMQGISSEPGAILYIDEIHNIVGAGQTGEGSMDASNLLKPYLEGGTVRFIGATTYEEYNRFILKNKGLGRRFQQVPIDEPSEEEALRIIMALKPAYEEFHHVTYDDDAIELAVKGSARHITDRYLPDKAIDIIDEAGAYVQAHRSSEDETGRVTSALVAEVLAKIAKVEALTTAEAATDKLESLSERIKTQIYGQDTAVDAVVEAVQMSKAGLTDENKPLASLLFVGPTGVGKTEVARVLARELGVELVRFDMSEYVEKHTVAKLIGSPAGYVGYDDGGLLTDAVRKHPDCVLLLDEIEKAHDDIFNLLLQVMDYGTLTDNKGRKAVFRNVVLIMTSNAGAQYARQASVGFASQVTAGDAMLKQVKKTFKPEFINRLSSIVVFNDMDETMAGLILDKKLRELDTMLAARNVSLTLTDETRRALLAEGYSREYGAREMDRVIHHKLKTRLVREILFGSLKNGGSLTL